MSNSRSPLKGVVFDQRYWWDGSEPPYTHVDPRNQEKYTVLDGVWYIWNYSNANRRYVGTQITSIEIISRLRTLK